MRFRWIGLWLGIALSTGCAHDEPSEVAGPPGVGGSGSGGSGGGTGGGLGGWPSDDAGTNCVASTLTSELVKKPLDIIIYLDSSDSMGSAVSAIQQSFDVSFSQTLEQSQVDYRVITIGGVVLVTNPADPSRYFQYELGMGSSQLPSAILTTFSTPPAPGKQPLLGWSQWTRPNASKAILAITDANSGPTWPAQQFEDQLFNVQKLPGFGTATDRNYRFHFMAGFIPKPPQDAWLPADPVVATKKCAKVGAYGQDLSILTGGLRFSMCEYTSYPDYFEQLAKSEVAEIPIQCQFPIPTDASGGEIDPNTIELELESGGNTQEIHQVHGQDECASGGFYVATGQIELCPNTCADVQASLETSLTVKHGCATSFVPR
jgi:hypothetical protein